MILLVLLTAINLYLLSTSYGMKRPSQAISSRHTFNIFLT